jgi:hypothetical protein
MIRAESQQVPDELLKFFSSHGPKRDSGRFWTLLTDWYQEAESKRWRASWSKFVFPSDTNFDGATFSGDANFDEATFSGDANFNGATFSGDANFNGATFSGDANFNGATFSGDASFNGATFSGDANFDEVNYTEDAHGPTVPGSPDSFAGEAHGITTFVGNVNFASARFGRDVIFSGARFNREADFGDAFFTRTAEFSSVASEARGATTFTGSANFRGAYFANDVVFWNVRFNSEALFTYAFLASPDFSGATFAEDARFDGASFSNDAIFDNVTFRRNADFTDATFSADARFSYATFTDKVLFRSIRFSGSRFILRGCSLANMELPPDDLAALASRIRFAGARDVDRLMLSGVQWPERGNRPYMVDEADLNDETLTPNERPSTEDVERVYRSMRKNLEDQSDRVGSHGWYFSEMEVGRLHARRTSLKWLSRSFYKATSNYGLSAVRPTIWLAVTVAIALLLFSLGPDWCPARLGGDPTTRSCVGLQDRLQVTLLAIFLQAPPSGIVLSGVLGQIVWLVLRVMGAAMLLSIGIAFRNQVAR